MITARAGSAENPLVHEGYLHKMGHSRRSWKKRWFCLFGTELRYFQQRPVAGGGNGAAVDYDTACKGRIENDRKARLREVAHDIGDKFDTILQSIQIVQSTAK